MSDWWKFERVEDERKYDLIPEGAFRVRIESADKTQSRTGNDMITIKLAVSGFNNYLWDHIVFLSDNVALTNSKITKLIDSFGIPDEKATDLQYWVGKVGACVVKHEEYNGSINPKVHYYLRKGSKEEQVLPMWVEKKAGTQNTNTTATKVEIDISPDELPF